MRHLKAKTFIILLLLSIFLLPEYSYAYLDPGTGSYLIQVILAGFLGIGIGIKLFWGRIKQLFAKTNKNKKID